MHHALIPVLALLLVGPVAAQDLGEPIPDCRALFKTTGFLKLSPDSVIEPVENGCHFTEIVADFGSFVRFAVRDITLTGPDLMASLAVAQRPTSIELAANGVRLSPDIEGSPLTAYIVEMQQDPYDLHLAMSWDDESGVLDIADASMSGLFLGRLAVSARLSGLQALPLEAPSIEYFAGVAMESLSIDFNNRSLFTAFMAPPLVGLLPYDEDPRPIIASTQQGISATINALPEAQLSAESKAALNQFVGDFPRPFGHYTMEVKGIDGSLPLDAMADLANMEDFVGILSRLDITASFSDPEGLRSTD